ncbi:hypothetical protein [Streptomyces sp. NPDC057412]|uniref:hypothetical protein n=1 Tax=Streptomyces sp. NPDC057412 TaxID=3346123 RepID=UPI0036AF04E2
MWQAWTIAGQCGRWAGAEPGSVETDVRPGGRGRPRWSRRTAAGSPSPAPASTSSPTGGWWSAWTCPDDPVRP